MHIPDGYLSPSTCAALYGAAAPFWYVALRRLKRLLNSRLIPLVSVFGAFCFVIMMFNLPLPGGTTGHAVGTAVAAVVLGPWAAILAVSTALAIQAVFFGDGGVTALGANCFNIAILGSLVAWGVYRLIAGRSPSDSRRRVVAAGAAGYLSINVAALAAAIEFGIQPLLFRDATGAPLYAPYPLSVAVPAMMIGHLTVAGLTEMLLSAGLIAWLQRSHPSLLKVPEPSAGWSIARPVLASLAGLLMLTPLGILAVGKAWGEWSPAEFSGPVPQGLERLSTVWTSPFPSYAPPFLHHVAFGYMLSGAFGVGLLLVAALLADRLLRRARERSESGF